jgi:hypothetical protein
MRNSSVLTVSFYGKAFLCDGEGSKGIDALIIFLCDRLGS